MVPIEEAATEFGLRSSEVVDRIQGLESMGRLTGKARCTHVHRNLGCICTMVAISGQCGGGQCGSGHYSA
jgi:hypothetical protein